MSIDGTSTLVYTLLGVCMGVMLERAVNKVYNVRTKFAMFLVSLAFGLVALALEAHLFWCELEEAPFVVWKFSCDCVATFGSAGLSLWVWQRARRDKAKAASRENDIELGELGEDESTPPRLAEGMRRRAGESTRSNPLF